MTAHAPAMDLLEAMVLEDGRRWGDAATACQRDAATTLLNPAAPPFRWESRPRGGSKTTDVAGIVLASMLTMLRPGQTADAYAADLDQARLIVDALRGLVRRTPGLASTVRVDNYRVSTVAGVTLEVMSADAASAHGRRPAWAVVDELANWPGTANARALWEVIFSSLPKVPGARLVVCTTAGDPASPWRKVRDAAASSPLWTVAEVPGPLPWIDPVQLAEQRRMLPDSTYTRLHLNEWASSEDRLVSAGVLAEATTLDGPLPAQPGVRYSIGLDVGLRHDRTALVVAHGEPVGQPTVLEPRRVRVVVDRVEVLEAGVEEVQLADIEALALSTSRAYHRAEVRLDPWQAIGLAQRLRSHGVTCEEATFSVRSLSAMTSSLIALLRDRLLALPADEGLRAELLAARVRESGSSGLLRWDHPAGGHDDRVTALGLAVTAVLDRVGWARRTSSAGAAAVPYTDRRIPGGAVPYTGSFASGSPFHEGTTYPRGTWAGSAR